MEEIIKITDLRLKTKEVIDKILNQGITGIIVSRSKPQVVIQTVKDYNQKEQSYIESKEELKRLRKKVFELNTLVSLKEKENGKVSGPFGSAEALFKHIDTLDSND